MYMLFGSWLNSRFQVIIIILTDIITFTFTYLFIYLLNKKTRLKFDGYMNDSRAEAV